MLIGISSSAHGVLVGYQLGSFPGGNNVRVWIEHWHGAATNVSGFPLQWRINTSSGVGTTYTTYATGYVNGQDSTTLQSNQSDIRFLSGSCYDANTYGNWVYWDFNISVCSTNPTQLEIIAGTAATTMEGCASLYPQTIGGVNAPTITASNLTYNQCPPLTLDPSTLTNYSVSSLCDANPKIVLGYGSSTWEVGTTPVPTWTINNSSQITITATDNNTLQTSTGGFQVNFVDNTSPTVITQDVYVTLDAQGQATITTADVDNGSNDNCSNNLSMSLSQTLFTCADGASKQVTLTVDDNNGNTATGTATVHISNSATPTIDIANSLCGSQGLYWATWNSVNSTSGSGTFGNLGVTVSVTHSAGGLSTTSTMYNHSSFPSQYSVPNTTTLRNDLAGTFTFCFSQPVTNPQIAFSSIGNPSTPVGISSSVPYQVIWSGTGVAYNSTTSFTGTEGFNIVSFPGTHQCITLTYAANETYANLAFGFENFNCTEPTICAGDQVTLTASGANSYVWTPSTGLSATNTASVVASPTTTTTYSVSDPTLPCSSPQTITIKVPNPTAPVASTPQTNCYGATLADLVATVPTGMSLDWYAASSGGTVLPLTTQLVDGTTYYAETTDITCGSSTTRTPVVATVIPQFSAPADVTVNTDASSCVASNVSLGGPTQSGQCYTLTNDAPTVYPIGSTTVTWTATYTDGSTTTSTQTVTVNDANLPWVSIQSNTTVSSNSAAVVLDPNATSGATQNINGANIVISDNFQSGDVISFASALPTGITSSYNSGSGVMTVTGTMTPAQFQSVLQSIQFNTTSNVNNANRTISVTAGSAVANTNGHYYEYVPGSLSWTAAKAAASQRTLNGLQGYLATVTSASENDFIESKVAANAWMGGSDDYAQINAAKGFTAYANQTSAEGNWHWVTGPEAGQVISTGNSPGVTVPTGSYAKWQSGEPNDYPNASTVGEENYLHIYSSSQGRWNDFPNTVGSGLGYVVEYGGLASDLTCLVFSDEIIVEVQTIPIVTTNASATTVASTSATIGGTVVNQGGSSVIDRGIVYSTSPNPTIANGKASAGTGTGSFVANLSGLQANTLYYAKAFATNGQGTAYGAQITFTTTPNIPNSISTTADVPSLGGAFLCPGYSVTLSSSVDVGTIEWFASACGSTVLGTGNTFTVTPSGTTTYYARASNSTTGLVSECTSVLVTVQDTFNPILVLNTGVSIDLDASGSATLNISDVDNGSYDDCGLTHVSFTSGSLTTSLPYSCSDLGSNTVNVYALDDNGNESVTSFTFTVEDNINPTAIAQNITVQLDANGQASITTADVDNGSNDNCSMTLSLDVTSFDCTDVGANTVTLTATDVSGNMHSTTATITVEDNIAPNIAVTDIQVSLGSDGTVTVIPSTVDDGTTDACGNLTWTLSDVTFDCSDIGAHFEVATVTDANGNSSSANVIITVSDNTAPVITTQPATLYLDASGQATLDSTDVISSIQENCAVASISLSQTSFNASTLGANTVTISVADASGNISTATVAVTVIDAIAPNAVTKDITISLDAQGSASISSMDVNNGSSDNVGIVTYTIDQNAFDCNDLGTNWVVLSATDASGNLDTAWSKVTVVDVSAPSVVTQNYSINLDASGNASITASDINAGSFDNCGIASMSLSKTAFSCADLGQNTITFTAVDGSGNSTSSTAVVTVNDVTAPVVSAQSATLYLDASGQATLDTSNVIISANDNCSIGSMSLSNTSFGCTNLGTSQVTLTVTDGSGNSASNVVDVTVLDTITPTVVVADTVTVYAGLSCSASATWSVIADDNCSYSISSNYASGSTFNLGYQNVVTTVTDPSGNSVSATTVIEVLDTISPVFTSSPFVSSIVPNTATCGSFVTWVSPVALDFCSGVTVTSSATNGTSFGLGTHTVTFTATDGAGNSSTRSISFTIVDDIAPEVIVPNDITVTNDAGQCGAVVNYAAAAALDNCNLDTVYYSIAPGSFFNVGQTQVLVSAIDAAGNLSTGEFTVTVEDTEAPTLVSVPNDTILGFCNASFVYPTPSFDDNCSVYSVTLISGIASGNVFPVGTTENVYVATDIHGNTDTVMFNVTVINQYPATLPFYGLVCSNSPDFDLRFGDSSLVFTGNYVTNNMFDPSASGPGEHNLVYAFTDSLGCVSYGTLTLSVEEAPTKPVVQRLGANYLTTQFYDKYQWFLNGAPIAGATSQNFVASVAGNYKVRVWNTAGCSDLSAPLAVGTVGLDEVSVDDLRIYPNPSQGLFNVDMTGLNEDISMRIYDSMGRFISEQKLSSGTIEVIDLSNSASGMYQLVLMDSEGNTLVRRVTIQK